MAKTRSPVKPLAAANRAEGFLHTSQTWWCSLHASAWCLLFSAQPCWFTSSCWSTPALQSCRSPPLPVVAGLHSCSCCASLIPIFIEEKAHLHPGFSGLFCHLPGWFWTLALCVFWCAGSPSLRGVVCEYVNIKIMLLRKILCSVTSQSEPWRFFLDIHSFLQVNCCLLLY